MSILFWIFFGWLADYSFPFGQALELFLSCFTGTVAAKINTLQQQLQRTDVISKPDNVQQIKKLNNLESQAWLYKGVLERFGADSSANHERIAKTLEALEYKRSEIRQELEPRKPRRYRILGEIQDSARSLLASQAEKDYERIQKIATNLIVFLKNKRSSPTIISDVIAKLASEIAKSGSQISPYRLRLVYRIDELLRVLSAKLVLLSNDPGVGGNYQSVVNELNSRLHTLSKEFDNLLRVRQEDKNELSKRAKRISDLARNISNLHKVISSRDSDIVNLRENIQGLQREIQSSTNSNHDKQEKINQLQSQLFQLNQQQSNLYRKIESLSLHILNKESEIEHLQSERSQINSQKLELQRQNQVLYQHFEHQRGEISRLNQKLEELSSADENTSQRSTSQPVIRKVETQETISEAEYQQIANQNEYEYVRGYRRSSGTWVSAYYRRKRNR
ncbi:MAG: hypothetical protein MH825_06720 [Cyanobacteria bacterium]|nr:hypothetical protein [Cyanobacteriota bacterium]